MRLAFSPRAIADIEAIGDYIRDDSPTAALRFVDDLRSRCRRILDAPQGGAPRPELGHGTRAIPFRRYVIFYDVDDAQVIIQRVLHSARDIGAVFDVE